MSSPTIRSLVNTGKFTTRVLIKRPGTDNVIDLGNILKFSYAPDVQRTVHQVGMVGDDGGGYSRANGQRVTTITDKATFELDSLTNDVLQLISFAGAPTTTDQAAAATHAVPAINVKKGETYSLGVYGITTQLLLFATTAKVENTDFTLDRASGLLTILTTGSITDGDALTGTVNVPLIKRKTFAAQKVLREVVSVEVQHFDEFAPTPRFIGRCATVDLTVTKFGDRDNTSITQVGMELLFIDKPTYEERQDA